MCFDSERESVQRMYVFRKVICQSKKKREIYQSANRKEICQTVKKRNMLECKEKKYVGVPKKKYVRV